MEDNQDRETGVPRVLRRTIARLAENRTIGHFIREYNLLPLRAEDVNPTVDHRSVQELAALRHRKAERRARIKWAIIGVPTVAAFVVGGYYLLRLSFAR